MTRPAPRKSTLSSSHPAAPRTPVPVADATPAVDLSAATRSKTRGPRATGRTKMTFYTTEEQAGQVRAVLANVPSAQHGYRNVSEFLDAAVAEKVESMQQRYNQGRAWPPAEAGSVARGRPVD